MARQKASAGTIELEARRSMALDRRRAGWSYQQIADSLGISVSMAHRDVQSKLAELREIAAERAEEVRELELQRLDEMARGVWDLARTGDDSKIATLLRIMDRRAKLTGIDAPTRAQVESDVRAQVEAPGVAAALRDVLSDLPADLRARVLEHLTEPE